MNKFNDNDIREALRRSEAKRQPAEVPDDFLANVMGKIEAEPEHKTIKLWRWVAAAACIAVVAGIGTAILFADKTIQDKGMTARIEADENTKIQQPTTVKTDTVTEPTSVPEPKDEAPKQKAKPKPAPNPNPNLRMERPAYAANKPAAATTDSASANNTASTTYAENQTGNNSNYLDPALMDKFILNMAEYQGVSRIKSECSIANDTLFDESFYVFPVKEDYDVLGNFLLMASQYSNTTPGYIFNNSEQQIFFTIDDEPNGLNYLWIAEQIGNSKIMIYSVHAPIDIEYKSDCYQQFYNNLTFANYNTYY
ncbi:MAG: hypothetical protein J6T98_09860 [Salinivirgaceae bacterium]|nr:hypothetical protein [Salinivirgaceae bacterium]